MEDDFERPQLEPKDKSYRLSSDWETDCMGLLEKKITIPSGFVTDGASIPRALWFFCGTPMDSPRIYAAIVHDWLYTSPHMMVSGTSAKACDRKTADKLYRDYQIALGISSIKAYTEYFALRAFGESHWKCTSYKSILKHGYIHNGDLNEYQQN